MHVGAGWILEWDDVVEWAFRDDLKLKSRYDKIKDDEDMSDRDSSCALKLTSWFEHTHFSRPLDAIVASDPAGEKDYLIIIRYVGEDAGGTFTNFKKFRELSTDVKLRGEIATALGIEEGKLKWTSVIDPYKEDRNR